MNVQKNALKRICLKGYKSIKELDIELRNLNILIGANGSGKSNFVSFFRMLNCMIDKSDGLRYFVGDKGGADKLFHYGYRTTQEINASLEMCHGTGAKYKYIMSLSRNIEDQLFFTEEKVSYTPQGEKIDRVPISLGGGHAVTMLSSIGGEHADYHSIRAIKNNMRRWRFFQFHDTSKDAYIRNYADMKDNKYLRDNAGNISAFLYMLRDRYPIHYKQILLTVKQIAPFIEDLVLEPEYGGKSIRLGWKEYNNDFEFSVDQMSDGTIRAIALVTLLLQPELPNLICIDEPELGLHPFAVQILAELIKKASIQSQIIVSTQSAAFVDCFELEDIVVVDRIKGISTFKRPLSQEYSQWLEEYTVSQLWDSNLMGGRPSR